VPAPPEEPIRAHVAYPIALDVWDGFAVVSFAALNVDELGWWCIAKLYRAVDGTWVSFNEYDCATTDTPFERPPAGSRWVEWMCDSGPLIFGDEQLDRHSFFGVAAAGTARLTVNGRDVPITAWNGAFAATAPGEDSVLVGYAADGTELGTL
jgi:hypothetical protein